MILVEKILAKARDRLVTIDAETPVTEAAKLLYDPNCRMVVVCDVHGAMIGVVTRTDVVRQIRHCQGCACTTGCVMVMTKQVVSCRLGDSLHQTWRIMKENGLKSVPVIDARGRPIGLLSARDVLEALLAEVEHEGGLLRDYVMCSGYR